jgi:diguanylate cyclase (GGDEF)-like protein
VGHRGVHGLELGQWRLGVNTIDPAEVDDGADSPSGWPRFKVGLFTAAVLIPILLLLAALPDVTVPFSSGSTWMILLITAGFVVSEPLVFHVEARNEAVSFSPTDVPLAFGLLILSPLALVAARLVGAAIGLIIWRRPPLFKLNLNLVAFTAETLIAMAIFRSVFDPGSPASLLMWLVLALSLCVGLVVGGVVIAVAISFFEGDLGPRVRKEFTHSYLFYLPGAVLGASVATPGLIAPWLVVIFLIPAPLVWLVLRSHGTLMHRYTDLSHIHEFSSEVGRSTELQEIADTAVREIAAHLRAQAVALILWDEGAGAVRAFDGDSALLDTLPGNGGDPVWAEVTATHETLLIDVQSARGAMAVELRRLGVEEGLVAPLRTEQTTLGVLVVANRHGAVDRFSADDRARLHSITEQLVVALRKGQLHIQIQHDATHDRLTGLPNRAYFEPWAEQMITSSRSGSGALLMLDLDRFKEVNDTLGHHMGDLLLEQVADRLRESVAEGDLAARFGGDEFAVFIPGAEEVDASLLAETISHRLEEPFDLRGTTVAIAGSIGIALVPEHGRSAESLLRRADLAMYDAKRRHSRSAVHHPDMEGKDTVRLAMLADLRRAVTAKSVEVYFQPKTDLRTGDVVAMEALARWTHPTRGAVGPDVFIPLAEQAGLIEALTEQVLDKALAAVGHWRELGYQVGVAVNLSPQSLVNEGLPRLIARLLNESGIPADLLTIEITEQSVIGETQRTVAILKQLHELGVHLSIDDFGTGFSSLTNLRHLPISELKIDRSFVSEMLVGNNDEVIVQSTIDLGHNLGFDVVAEGVETAAITDRLRTLGCDLVQGYGICRPLPLPKIDEWLRTAQTRPSRVQSTTVYQETATRSEQGLPV